jgi:hypothetical protein
MVTLDNYLFHCSIASETSQIWSVFDDLCIKRLAIGEIILYYEEPTLKAEISDKIPIGTYIYRPIPTYAIENLREEIVK